MFGYLMEKEVKAVDKVLNDIQRPFTAIMGDRDTDFTTHCFGECISHTTCDDQVVYLIQQVFDISICEDDKLDLALDLIKKAKEKGVNLVLAVDAKIASTIASPTVREP